MAKMKITRHTDEILDDMIKTFHEKNTRYKSNFFVVGEVMRTLFPDGIHLVTERDHIVYHEFSWLIGKLTRFTQTGMKDEESLYDMTVYGALLLSIITATYDEETDDAQQG